LLPLRPTSFSLDPSLGKDSRGEGRTVYRRLKIAGAVQCSAAYVLQLARHFYVPSAEAVMHGGDASCLKRYLCDNPVHALKRYGCAIQRTWCAQEYSPQDGFRDSFGSFECHVVTHHVLRGHRTTEKVRLWTHQRAPALAIIRCTVQVCTVLTSWTMPLFRTERSGYRINRRV
jgi:hypothetical protein